MFSVRSFITLGVLLSYAPGAWAHVPQNELRQMEARVKSTVAKGEVPVLIFDLDETLVDSTPRKYMAFRDAVKELCWDMDYYDRGGGFGFIKECERAITLHQSQFYALDNRYAILSFFDSHQFSESWKKDLDQKMTSIYLSGQRLELDREIPGAVTFIKKMRSLGAKLYFVSSRSDSGQRKGTLANLRALGMDSPTLEQEVILKPDGMKSLEFKKKTFAMIHQQPGRVVGVFENEPENMNAMIAEFPGALAYFIRGAWLVEEEVSSKAIQLDDYYTF